MSFATKKTFIFQLHDCDFNDKSHIRQSILLHSYILLRSLGIRWVLKISKCLKIIIVTHIREQTWSVFLKSVFLASQQNLIGTRTHREKKN